MVSKSPSTAEFGVQGKEATARVLIVDDDERTRIAVAALLRSTGVEVDHATGGAEALIRAREWHPDVILLDVMMPEVDGFEVCRRLRADPEIADVRVLLLTSLDDSASRLSGFEAGADDFITKPLNRQEMLSRIKGIARLNRFRALIEQHRRLIAMEHSYAAPSSLPTLTDEEMRVAYDRAVKSLRLVFHPIVEVLPGTETVRPIAHEALLRTSDSQLPGPLAMIAAAALLGRLKDLGRAIRRAAAEIFHRLPVNELLFVNMNPAELLDDELYTGADPLCAYSTRVVFELTERESLDDIRHIRDRLASLRRLGYRFAIDDLGGGYSSLNAFAIVEPEFVKLDRHLVRGVAAEPTREKIVRSMIGLCEDLGISLIVEGIETRDEQRVLAAMGCRFQQGYVYGRPTDAHPMIIVDAPEEPHR